MFIMVDVEADGPCPGEYSMVALGAVAVEEPLMKNFYATFRPVSEKWIPEALKVCGFSREDTLLFDKPERSMEKFSAWLDTVKKSPKEQLRFISDNNGFDWQFVNYYFWRFQGGNPFGHSSTNLGSFYKGVVRNFFKSFKHLRETTHDHHPLNDAKGNAEALVKIVREFQVNGIL
jgi:hypothetical protein